MIVAGTCSSRAIQATPWAMLPALVVRTPSAIVSRAVLRIALAAPRILNEPIGCRHSSLSQISAGDFGRLQPHERRPDRNVGDPLAGCRGCRRAESEGGRSEVDLGADPALARSCDAQLRSGEILDGDAERLEQRQLAVVAASRVPADEDVAELGRDVIGPNALLVDRVQVVAGLVQRRLAPVDEERRRGDGLRARALSTVGTDAPTALTCVPGASQSSSTIGSRAAVAVHTMSAPSSASSIEAATSEWVSSARASAWAGLRLQIRMIGSSITVCIASTWERPCTPDPSTATVRASLRASAFVAAAETAAVRISVIGRRVQHRDRARP